MMLRRACSHVQTLAPWRHLHRLPPHPLAVAAPHLFSSPAIAGGRLLTKKVEDLMPIATGLERDELEAELEGRKQFDMDAPSGPFGTKEASAVVQSYYNKRIVDCPGGEGGHFASLRRVPDIYPKRLPGPFHHCLQSSGYFTSRSLSAEDVSNMEPISSPLTPLLGMGTKAKDAGSKPPTVQAIKKGIKQSPKKVNLVAKLVRGMRVEDALLQLQVTVKRAAKTVYQVIHSARANAAHNHGLDPDRLLVAEAFVGKGLYLKRPSFHAKGKWAVMERPRCRLTVVVRETTPEEEAKIAKLRVSNYKKLTKTERQLVPHQLIETTPRWGRKREDVAS